jgi:UDP-N-acetylglucosamine 2-epimerase (non-hydrolysing)
MFKVMTIVGTRPELIKMSKVIGQFDKFTNHILVHTGQNYDYELNEIFFKDLEIRKPDYFLDVASDNNKVAQTISNIIAKSDEIMSKEKPDALLLYGDTNSCLSVISAKRRKIPVFHMEAGNRCFDERVPEELNRKVVDHLSDINYVLTEHARRYLIREGIKPETIIKTGSHMTEVLECYMPIINKSDVLNRLRLKPKNFFVVSAHREENIDSEININDLLFALNAISEKYKMPIVVSTHPRTKKRLQELKLNKNNPNIKFLKPFGFFDYIKLQLESLCVISDSGTITEESSILNFPAITIRNTHERPEGMDAGTLIMSGLKSDRVLNAIEITINKDQTKEDNLFIPDYMEGKNVSSKILKSTLSYIDYINRTVWSKI